MPKFQTRWRTLLKSQERYVVQHFAPVLAETEPIQAIPVSVNVRIQTPLLDFTQTAGSVKLTRLFEAHLVSNYIVYAIASNTICHT